MNMIPTSEAKASSVNLVKYLQNENWRKLEFKSNSQPDNGRAVHGHDDDAEEGGPESDPEPRGEIVPLRAEAVVHQDLLEDEDGSGAAEDSERLSGKQTEHPPGQEVPHEGLQHSLQAVSDVPQEPTKRYRLRHGGWNWSLV